MIRRYFRPLKKIAGRLGLDRVTGKIHFVWMRFCARSGVTSDVYFLLNGRFRREHRAVLSGMLQHRLSSVSPKGGSLEGAEYTLRRNIHRLEKGLIMRPRRPVFAVDYITETVKCFELLASHKFCGKWEGAQESVAADSNQTDADLDQYALSVLAAYFDAVDVNDEVVANAKTIFEQACRNAPAVVERFSPYERKELDHEISYESLLQLSLQRRSCRWYSNGRVPVEVLEKSIRVASLSPSACNRQPFRYVIFDDPGDAGRVASIPMGTRGYSQQVPCLIVVVGDLAAYPFERDRHAVYVDASLASMALIFALEVQGLVSCCINWPDIEKLEKKMERELGLSAHERPLMCLSVGYPLEGANVPFSQKKAFSELATFQSSETTKTKTHSKRK